MDVSHIKKMLSSCDVDDVYDALIDIGKSNNQELIGDVVGFLEHDEPDIQRAAIMVLGTHWKMPEFKDRFFTILNENPNDDVRVAALTNWVGYYQGSEDKEVLRKLCDLLRDSSEDMFIRMESFRSLGRVAKVTVDESTVKSLEMAKSYKEFESLVPWDLVDGIVGDLR